MSVLENDLTSGVPKLNEPRRMDRNGNEEDIKEAHAVKVSVM